MEMMLALGITRFLFITKVGSFIIIYSIFIKLGKWTNVSIKFAIVESFIKHITKLTSLNSFDYQIIDSISRYDYKYFYQISYSRIFIIVAQKKLFIIISQNSRN